MTKSKQRNASRRLVLAFPPTAIPQPAIDSAAQLARLLGASLFGLFVENSELLAAANLPFLRELDAHMRAWRPLSHQSLVEDYTAVASALRRQLLHSAAQLGVEAEFEVFRGDPRAAVASGTVASDLVALFEPITNWTLYKESVAAGTVFVPRTARPQTGPVVVIARQPQDREVQIASEIAANTNMHVVVVDAAQEQSSAYWLERGARGAMNRAARIATSAEHFLQLGLPPASLVVVTRATLERFGEPLESIAAGRPEPWLVLEDR